MRNICSLIGQNSLHISDIFNCYSANINGMWNAQKAKQEIQNIWNYTNLKHACKTRVDQHLIGTNAYSILINKILVMEWLWKFLRI